jgi:hypothetical protein
MPGHEEFVLTKNSRETVPLNNLKLSPFLGGKEDVARLEIPVDHRAPHVVKKTHTLNHHKTVEKL